MYIVNMMRKFHCRKIYVAHIKVTQPENKSNKQMSGSFHKVILKMTTPESQITQGETEGILVLKNCSILSITS